MSKSTQRKPQYITLYAIQNHFTGKLLNTLTNPKHKFWERRAMAERAMM